MRIRNLLSTALVAASIAASPALAETPADIKLPGSMSWSCWSQGSGSYNQAVAIGTAFKNELGVNLQLIPAQTDLARQLPLRDGRVSFSCTGSGTYLSQEGLTDFAIPDWGPQPVRLFALNVAPIHAAIVVGGDTGVKTMADLKGKRVAYVMGTPSLNQLVEANLAFAGLTWSDVERVEVPGFGAAADAIMEGRVDAILLSASTAQATQLEASARGGYYPPLPHDDTEGWERLKAIAPYVVQIKNATGAMVPDSGFDGAALPLPFMATYANVDEELVYNVTKALFELHPVHRESTPAGFDGLGLDVQILDYIVPYHDGAIRYFKEKGVWSDAYQAHNDRLVERQAVLKEAWDTFMAAHDEKEDFGQAWLQARQEALDEAGF